MHRINLGGPWTVELAGRCGSAATVPFSDLATVLESTAGPVRLTRRFHWPASPDPATRILLRLPEFSGTASVVLNETNLGAAEASAGLDVTHHVRPSNLLAIELQGPAALKGNVSLEIEDGLV